MRVFMGLSLNSIMNKLILLQLILLPSAFKILLPMNVIEVSRVLLSLAFFDILPSEDITRAMFDVRETDATYERLEKLGLESDNFLLNVGSSLIFLHLQFAIIFLGLLLFMCSKCCKSCTGCLTKVKGKIWRVLIWNGVLDLLFSVQIELQLCSFIQLQNVSWGGTFGDAYSMISAMVVAAIYCLMPFIVGCLLYRNAKRDMLEQPSFKKRYGTLTEELRLKNNRVLRLALPLILWLRATIFVT